MGKPPDDQGPGSISPNLYWRRAGTFTLLPPEKKGERIHFYPPNSFREDAPNRLE
jgi:hypothetical protein